MLTHLKSCALYQLGINRRVHWPWDNKNAHRDLWQYVAKAFNMVDPHRLQEVGPDRMCAEWILKNGGAIRIVENADVVINQYNALPPENFKFRVKEVDASGASIMKVGLEHFKGCAYIDTVILHKCLHLEEDGLEGIVHLQNTLLFMEISVCHNITAKGLMVIGKLKNLKHLAISDMKGVDDLLSTKIKLQAMLPQCNVI